MIPDAIPHAVPEFYRQFLMHGLILDPYQENLLQKIPLSGITNISKLIKKQCSSSSGMKGEFYIYIRPHGC